MLLVRMLTVGLHVLVSLVALSPPAAHAAVPPRAAAVAQADDADVAQADDADVARDAALASTYDEAACDPSDSGECAADVELSLPTASAPAAILDCNDARTNALLADMIGTCDMPRRSGPPTALPTVRTGSNAPQLRMTDGPHGCDRCPLRGSPPRGDDSPSLPAARVPLEPPLAVSSLAISDAPLVVRAEDLRLDRPPRL